MGILLGPPCLFCLPAALGRGGPAAGRGDLSMVSPTGYGAELVLLQHSVASPGQHKLEISSCSQSNGSSRRHLEPLALQERKARPPRCYSIY